MLQLIKHNYNYNLNYNDWYFAKDTIMHIPPKMNIITKSAVLLRKDPSSNIRQYRYVKIILNNRLNPIFPKNRNVVINRHI